MQKTIMIVENCYILREGIKQLLEPFREIVVKAEALNSGEAKTLLEKLHCSVILMGNSERWMTELASLRLLKLKYPEVPVILLHDELKLNKCSNPLDKYADTWLPMNLDGNMLVKAIQKVTPTFATRSKRKTKDLAKGELSPHHRLSHREFEVLCLMAQGKTNSQIAKLLNLSSNAISTYRQRLLVKLCCDNNAQLMHYAIKNELVA